MAKIPFATGFDTGLTSMGFTLIDLDGTVHAARSTVGVSEVGVGRYATTETAPDASLPLVVRWDDTAGGEAFARIDPSPVALTSLTSGVDAGTEILNPLLFRFTTEGALTNINLHPTSPSAVAVFGSVAAGIDPAIVTFTRLTGFLYQLEFSGPLVDTSGNPIVLEFGDTVEVGLSLESDENPLFDVQASVPVGLSASTIATALQAIAGDFKSDASAENQQALITELAKVKKVNEPITHTNASTGGVDVVTETR